MNEMMVSFLVTDLFHYIGQKLCSSGKTNLSKCGSIKHSSETCFWSGQNYFKATPCTPVQHN